MFHPYGLMIGIGIFAGILVVQRQVKHMGVDPTIIDTVLPWIVIPAIIGARGYHVITDWQIYAGRPFFSVFEIWNGGLGFFGALMGGIIGIIIFIQRKGLMNQTPTGAFFLVLDMFSFGAPLAQAIGRFGNYFNHELYGLPTDLPWGIMVNGQKYHPLFAYEAILNLCVFGILNWLGWKKKLILGKGQYACIYLASYGLIRFWLEFLRVETARWDNLFGVFSIAQWVALGITIGAVAVFWLRRHAPKTAWELKTLL